MLKAITTTLLLAASSVATAETPYSESPYSESPYSESPYSTPYTAPGTAPYATPYAAPETTPYMAPYTDDYRGDARDHYGHDDGPFRSRAVLLAQNVLLNRDHRPTWLPIDSRFGVKRLRLDLLSGRAYVGRVTIVFMDGHRETLDVGQPLTRRSPSMTINLTHSGVRGVLIESSTMYMSNGVSWGGGQRRNHAAINVIGLRR